MRRNKRYEALLRLALLIAALVLVNIAGSSLNFRADFTRNNRYSLSSLSKDTVSGLREPLTVKAFFSKDMPPQYSRVKRYLLDILQEYSEAADRDFNYQLVEVTGEGKNAERAKQYGIDPVQVQVVRKDEVKYKKAYMGLVLIHGDAVAKIPVVSSAGQLEYKLTSRMQTLRNRVSVLLGLEDSIEVSLYLSPSLQEVAPHVGMKDMDGLPEKVKKAVKQLNRQSYGKLTYNFREFEPEGNTETVEKLDLQTLKWPSSAERGIEAGKGSIGLVLRHGESSRTIDLLKQAGIPGLGKRYQLVDSELKELISTNMDSLLQINQELGYLTGHDTLPLGSRGLRSRRRGPKTSTFQEMVTRNYSLQKTKLEEGIPEGLGTLVIAGPKAEFSDFELYQLDQALMQGTNLAVFLDSYVRDSSRSRMAGYQENDTGLDRLLGHYGLQLKDGVVMDERCFRQKLSEEQGGGQRPIYFAPKIANRNINHDLAFLENIKGLITYKAAPVYANSTRISAQDIKAEPLFSSSRKSWLQSKVVRLRPSLLAPPEDPDKMESYPLGYLASGTFSSYFSGKRIPERSPEKEQKNATGKQTNETQATGTGLAEELQAAGTRLDKSKEPGSLVLVGSSSMLTDQILDSGQGRGQGQTPNQIFVMNLLDSLSGKMDMARLRSGTQTFNPLNDTSQFTRQAIKTLNILVLPLAVLSFGLAVWFARSRRKKAIRRRFAANG